LFFGRVTVPTATLTIQVTPIGAFFPCPFLLDSAVSHFPPASFLYPFGPPKAYLLALETCSIFSFCYFVFFRRVSSPAAPKLRVRLDLSSSPYCLFFGRFLPFPPEYLFFFLFFLPGICLSCDYFLSFFSILWPIFFAKVLSPAILFFFFRFPCWQIKSRPALSLFMAALNVFRKPSKNLIVTSLPCIPPVTVARFNTSVLFECPPTGMSSPPPFV